MCELFLYALLAVAQSDDDVVREYDRREQIVAGELARRREHLRVRLRALYKLERGGFARLLAEAGSRDEFFARRAAANRILERDLSELRQFARERTALMSERSRLAAARVQATEPAPLFKLRSPLAHPLVVGHFGPYEDPDSGLELERRGVLLATHPGEEVRAPAAGVVRFAGEVAGLGQTVVIEHDGGLYTVAAGLAATGAGAPGGAAGGGAGGGATGAATGAGTVAGVNAATVVPGDRVAAGDPIGTAAGTRLRFQVRRGMAALDPEPLLRHTGRR